MWQVGVSWWEAIQGIYSHEGRDLLIFTELVVGRLV